MAAKKQEVPSIDVSIRCVDDKNIRPALEKLGFVYETVIPAGTLIVPVGEQVLYGRVPIPRLLAIIRFPGVKHVEEAFSAVLASKSDEKGSKFSIRFAMPVMGMVPAATSAQLALLEWKTETIFSAGMVGVPPGQVVLHGNMPPTNVLRLAKLDGLLALDVIG